MYLLHTMLRVNDMQQSIDFYTKILGMQLIRTTDRPDQKYSLAFLGYGKGNAEGTAELELTFNYGVDNYDQGNAYGHIAIGVKDVYETCNHIRASGARITREPGPVKGGETLIAFVEDPNGYKIELIQTNSRTHP